MIFSWLREEPRKEYTAQSEIFVAILRKAAQLTLCRQFKLFCLVSAELAMHPMMPLLDYTSVHAQMTLELSNSTDLVVHAAEYGMGHRV